MFEAQSQQDKEAYKSQFISEATNREILNSNKRPCIKDESSRRDFSGWHQETSYAYHCFLPWIEIALSSMVLTKQQLHIPVDPKEDPDLDIPVAPNLLELVVANSFATFLMCAISSSTF